MAEQSLIPGVDPIIISVKSKSWPLGGRWVGGVLATSLQVNENFFSANIVDKVLSARIWGL